MPLALASACHVRLNYYAWSVAALMHLGKKHLLELYRYIDRHSVVLTGTDKRGLERLGWMPAKPNSSRPALAMTWQQERWIVGLYNLYYVNLICDRLGIQGFWALIGDSALEAYSARKLFTGLAPAAFSV